MCTYGNKSQKTVTDVFWKEGCKVPELMVSEVMALIERGIMSASSEEQKAQIFEATLHIWNVQKGTSIDDLKKFLVNFKNEMYTQKSKQVTSAGEYYVHFYKRLRAKDALTYIRNTPNQFCNVEMVIHQKQAGVNSETTPQQDLANQERKNKAKKAVVDDDGFTKIVKK